MREPYSAANMAVLRWETCLMGSEESGNVNKSSGSQDPSSGADESASEEKESSEDRSGRMNAAKAFYRQLYAGEDVVPNDFGLTMNTQGAGGAAAGGGGGGGERSGPCNNCQYLETQLSETQAKASEWENLYKRMAADFENYRRRVEREREEFQQIGMQKAIEAVLPAMDDMDRAKLTLTDKTDPKTILESLNLVISRFARCLDGIGVKTMEVINEPFDPRMHEPVQEIETSEFADGAVMHELRKGYMIKDKVLRPALVNVASNSGPPPPPKPPAPAEPEAQSSPAAEEKSPEPEPEPEPVVAEAPAPAPEPPAPEPETAPAPEPEPEKPEEPPADKAEDEEEPMPELKLDDLSSKLAELEAKAAGGDSAPANRSESKQAHGSKEKGHGKGKEKEKEKDEFWGIEGGKSGKAGSDKQKRADKNEEFNATATADLPVFELGETLTDDQSTVVYDISDADTEEADESTYEKKR